MIELTGSSGYGGISLPCFDTDMVYENDLKHGRINNVVKN